VPSRSGSSRYSWRRALASGRWCAGGGAPVRAPLPAADTPRHTSSRRCCVRASRTAESCRSSHFEDWGIDAVQALLHNRTGRPRSVSRHPVSHTSPIMPVWLLRRTPAVSLVAALLEVSSCGSHRDPEVALRAAEARLQANDPAGAEQILRDVSPAAA